MLTLNEAIVYLPASIYNMSQPQPIRLTLKSSILDRNRSLVIDSNYIEFDDTDLIGKPLTRFTKDDIKAYRYGISWIRGYQFAIGRIYCIDIQANSGKTIKLRLKTIYGIRKKQLSDKYVQVITALNGYFFEEIARSYLNLFDNQMDFELGGLVFSQAGIAFDSNTAPVHWQDIGTHLHTTYYTIYPKPNPNAYKAFEYLHHWNTGIIYSVSRSILKSMGLYNE